MVMVSLCNKTTGTREEQRGGGSVRFVVGLVNGSVFVSLSLSLLPFLLLLSPPSPPLVSLLW